MRYFYGLSSHTSVCIQLSIHLHVPPFGSCHDNSINHSSTQLSCPKYYSVPPGSETQVSQERLDIRFSVWRKWSFLGETISNHSENLPYELLVDSMITAYLVRGPVIKRLNVLVKTGGNSSSTFGMYKSLRAQSS